jgi:hypothetical protein
MQMRQATPQPKRLSAIPTFSRGGNVMVAEVFAGLGAIKTAFDIAKGLKDIDDAARRNAAVIELQEKILTAQQAQSTLIEHVRELEKEVADLKAWDADKQRYQLKSIRAGVTVYALKPGMENGEELHYLCTNCYQHGHKSILQEEHLDVGRVVMHVCHRCGSEYIEHGARHEPPRRRPTSR